MFFKYGLIGNIFQMEFIAGWPSTRKINFNGTANIREFLANYVPSCPKALQPLVRYSTEKVRDFCHAIKLS